MSLISEVSRYEKWLKLNGGYNLSSIDYNYKSFILDNGLDKALNKINYSLYCNDLLDTFGVINDNCFDRESISLWLEDIFKKYGASAIIESYRLNNARYHRLSRLRYRISSIISYRSFFLTLTFTDDVLARTSAKTRREYVTRFLKKFSTNYVANIDFGARKGREHYHAVIQCNKIISSEWSYGNIDFELVSFNDNTSDVLSKYVSKLVNHAIKDTCRRNYIIYPKIRS